MIAAPAYLSGLIEETRERLKREYWAEMMPEPLGQLDAIERSLEVVQRAHDQLGVHVANSYDWQQVALLERGAAAPEAA